MFQVFHTYVAGVLSEFAKVDLDIAYVCNGFQVFLGVFQVFQMYVRKCFICFRCMLQVFYLDVIKVDLVLHMLGYACYSCRGTAVGHHAGA
jgi:hypothetical protein